MSFRERLADPATRRWVMRAIKFGIVGLLIWGGHKTIAGAYDELTQKQFDWSTIQPWWLVAAAAVYILGQFPMAIFWRAILVDLGQQPPWYRTIRANIIGHLGKYVPGKALVVVLRTALVKTPRVHTGPAVASIFYETFTAMAVGSLLAVLVLLPVVDFSLPYWQPWHWFDALDATLKPGSDPRMFLLALSLTVVTGIPTIPRVFDWVLVKLRKIRQPKPGQALETEEDLEPEQPTKPGRFHLRPQTLVLGWVGDMIAWALMGWSLWATIRALGVDLDLLTHWPLLTACTALALVAGFVSLIPGGAGVRELVFILLLKPLVHGDALLTVAIPIVLRVEWLLAELAMAGVFYIIPPREET